MVSTPSNIFIMVKTLQEIITEHNRLYKRISKAEKLFEDNSDRPASWIKAYKELLIEFSNNFNEFYYYYSKSSVDEGINSNKELSIEDFALIKLNEDRF